MRAARSVSSDARLEMLLVVPMQQVPHVFLFRCVTVLRRPHIQDRRRAVAKHGTLIDRGQESRSHKQAGPT